MTMEMRTMFEPPFDHGRCVGTGIVQHQVDLLGGIDAYHPFQENEKLLMAVSPMKADHHVAGADVQGGEQVQGPMSEVVVGPPGHRPRPQRQERLRPLHGLELRLGIEGEHQGVVGWMQVESHHVQDFLGEMRIAAELERPALVWLEGERSPDTVHRHVADPDLAGQAPGAPVRGVLRQAQGSGDDLLDLSSRIPTRTPSAWPFLKTGQPGGGKTLPPGSDRMEVQVPPLGNGSVGGARCGLQDDPTPLNEALRRGTTAHPPLQRHPLFLGKDDKAGCA